MAAAWILVRTHPLQEAFAVKHVRRVGETCYCPMFWDGQLKRRVVLFACYLFAAVRDGHFSWLNFLPGISHVVHFGEHPALVPVPVIESLRKRENAHGNVVLPHQEELAAGDRVRILGGPLDQRIGLFQGMSTRERVCVLLTFLGESNPVYLERAAVERVP